MDVERTIAEIECLERIFAVPDTRPLSERPLGYESEARQNARAKPVVPVLAALWSLLPLVNAFRQTSVRLSHCVSSC